MRSEDFGSPRPEHALAIAAVLKLLAGALKKAADLEEQLDEIHQLIRELVERLGWPLPRVRPFPASISSSSPPSEDELLKGQAKEGVATATLERQPNGKAILHIEGRTKIPLSTRLAALMGVLLVADGASPDALVPWKADADIIAELERRLGKVYDQHGLKQMIYLLREDLRTHGENRWLIMTEPKLGSRFALRHGSALVTRGNHN